MLLNIYKPRWEVGPENVFIWHFFPLVIVSVCLFSPITTNLVNYK